MFRYLKYLIFVQLFLGVLGNLFLFPLAYIFRSKIRRKNKPKLLWWLLHDGSDYGDKYFLNKYNNKRNFWTAWIWVWRNPIHNWYYSNTIEGTKSDYKGWATCQKYDNGLMWRTCKTNYNNGAYADKYGSWINIDNSILGKQRITFKIDNKKYFRYSYARPIKLIKNLWWVPSYKFGFENVNWAIQFQPFLFKKYNGNIKYTKICLQ